MVFWMLNKLLKNLSQQSQRQNKVFILCFTLFNNIHSRSKTWPKYSGTDIYVRKYQALTVAV